MTKALRRVKETATQMTKKRFIQVSGLSGLIFVLLSFALPIWQLFPELKAEPAIPLHYNIHFGIDMFGPWWQIFTFPIIGAGILIFNFILAFAFWRRDRVLSYFFTGVAVMTSLVIFVSTIFVVFLNASYD